MSEQTAVDWRALPAGAALDRIVAERAGWTEIIEYRDDTVFGYPPGQMDSEALPRYSIDANAATRLPLAPYSRLDILIGTDYVSAAVTGCERFAEKSVDKLAEVAVKAWLAWKDGQRE